MTVGVSFGYGGEDFIFQFIVLMILYITQALPVIFPLHIFTLK